MDPLYELDRYNFVVARDGLAEARAYAKRSVVTYLASARNRRIKYGKRDDYRALYLESAMSFRHILRNIK
jgi:hypothetical protein